MEVTPEPSTIPATEPGILTPTLEDEVEAEMPADDRSPRTLMASRPRKLRWQGPALGLSRSHNMSVIFLTMGVLILDWFIEASLWLKS